MADVARGRWWSGPWPPRRRGVMRTPPGWPVAAMARAASRSHRASLQPRGAPPRPRTRWAPTRRGPWTTSTGQRSCRALVSTWSACSARAPLAECTWSTTAAGGGSSRPRCSTPTTAACGPTACARLPTCGDVCTRTSSPRTAPRSTAHLCTCSRRRWSTTSARLATVPPHRRSGAASLEGSHVAWPTSTGCP